MHVIVFILRYFEEIVAGTFMTVMTMATVSNVIARYAFNSPVQWAEELSRYSFIWLVFIGAAICSKHKRHITIDVLQPFLPRQLQLIAMAAISLGIMALMVVIIYYSWILMVSATHPTAELKIPQYMVYLAVPVSASLILFHALTDLRGTFKALARGGEQA
jgi:TRAP-type transport system small permease protein